jgi:hypothetical protein
MEGFALARRALGRSAGSKGDFPHMLAVVALKRSHLGHLDLSSFNSEGAALDQRLGDLFASRLDDPAEGLP